MEQTIVKLQRQYHQLDVECNDQKKYILGRDIRRGQVLDPNSTFVRCSSEFVSRKHTEIFSDSHGVWKIKDLGSMNGTFLGSTRLATGQQRELRNGDVIGLGISGEEPFDENITITDANYYIFKFVEDRIFSEAEIIDLTDEEDACTVVSTPSTKLFPVTPSKKLKSKAHDIDVPRSSASSKAELHKQSRDGRNKKENAETDSVKSSRSKEKTNYHKSNSRSRSVSPNNRFKNKPDKPKYSRNYLSTSSEDDSSDGLPELNRETNVLRRPGPLSKKLGNSTKFEKSKTSSNNESKKTIEEDNYIKPLQSLNHQVSRKGATKEITKHTNEQLKSSACKSKVKGTGKEYLPCFVELNNVFQANESGILVLTPSVNKLLTKDGCIFSQLSQEDQNLESVDFRGAAKIQKRKEENDQMFHWTKPFDREGGHFVFAVANSPVKIDSSSAGSAEKRCKKSEDKNSDFDLSHPPKKQKQMQKRDKAELVSESDEENERDEHQKDKKNKIIQETKKNCYRPAPLSRSKAQACVKPIRRDQNFDKIKESTRRAALEEEEEEEEIILPPVEATRNYSDEEQDLPMDIDPVDDENDEIEADEDEPVDTIAAKDNESLSRIISHNINKTRVPQRQIKMLDDAPSPISIRRKGFGTVERVSAVPSGALPPKPVSEWRNTDPMSSAQKRLEKLKEIAKINAEKKLQNPDEGLFKKPISVPKVKNSNKSRSESLLYSMVGPAEIENLEKKSEAVVVSSTKAPETSVAQRRELPPPNPEDVAKMPLHNLLNSHVRVPSIQDARCDKIVPPTVRGNPMQKPNAIVYPSPEANNDKIQFHIHNKKVLPGPSHRKTNLDGQILLEDTIYKDICNWNPSWLEEQKKFGNQRPPAVENGAYRPPWSVIQVLGFYVSYDAYISVYYPLMLHELWASIHNDLISRERDKGMEFKVGIERYLQQDICPQTPQMELGIKQGQWIDVRCHVLVNNRKDFKFDLDLCLLRYWTKTRNSKKEEQFSEKVTFAFLTFNSVKYEDIKNPTAKLKITFSVSFHIKAPETFYIATERVAVLRKLSYISPTLRNYKALINLPNFPLYKNILNPQKPDNPWQYNELARYDSLVSYCSSLNPRQKSVVDYVTNRIMKAPGKPDIMLIHGPPGTGKTKTIIGIIMQIITSQEFRRENPKMLVCTPSNTAIDEIISRLHDIFRTMTEEQRPLLVRIGEVGKVSGTATQYTADCIAQRKMTNASAYDSIAITIEQKRKEIKEKEAEKASLIGSSGTGNTTRLRALDREIKSMKEEIDRLEANKKLVLTATRADQEQVEKVKSNIIASAQIICSTLTYCSNSKLKSLFDVATRKQRPAKPNPKFSFCIVDEATQTTEPESLAPLTFNIDKLVLVGDPMQLDATVLSQKAKDNLYGRSLYHRLYDTYTKWDPSPVMMLRDQYRMHEEILKWPNDSFYGGKLIKKPIRKNHVLCPLAPYLFFNLISRESADKGNISNEEETLFVIEMLKAIGTKLNSQHKFSIGVITPYGRQKDILTRTIRDKVPDFADIVEVDTVDSFQGREKDIVLISCVRTNAIGFLNNPKRLNVALTRAVHSLFIIGNANCLKKDDMWESLIEDAESRKIIHSVPTDKTKQPGLLANILSPIISSPRKSTDDRRPNRLGI